jgi:hypothetical protein
MNITPRLFEADARTEFGQIEFRCRKCVERAEGVWNAACDAAPRLRKAARGRGRNSIFAELVADFVREEFAEDAEVDVCEQFGTVRLHIKRKYDVGFKKMDEKGRFCNYLTRRRLLYNDQLPLDGYDEPLEEAIRLHVGIQWNNAGTEIIDVMLAYPYRRTSLWKYPLATEAIEKMARMPAPKPAARTRIRSKIAMDGDAKQKKAE